MASRGAVCTASGLLLGALLLLAAPVSALRIDIPDNPVLGQDALRLTPVSGTPGVGEFQVVGISAAYVPSPYTNVAGQRIQFVYDFTFGPSGTPNELEYMVVFTSVRKGFPPVITCASLAPGGDLPPSDFDYASDGYSGAFLRQTTSTDSPIPDRSQICSGEDAFAPWDSLIFDAVANSTFQVSFEVEQLINGIDTSQIAELRVLLNGFSAVPEPNSGMLLLVGLMGLVGVARSRRAGR